MSNLLMRAAVKTWYTFTGREKVSLQIQKSLDKYLALTRLVNAESGMSTVFVPRMIGIDEDMRNWSLFMILEHNAIVNRSITSIIQSLVTHHFCRISQYLSEFSGLQERNIPLMYLFFNRWLYLLLSQRNH